VRILFVIGDLLVRFGAIIAPLGLKAKSRLVVRTASAAGCGDS
jgi:hypothetical protein